MLRALAESLGPGLKTSVAIDYKPGASGLLAAKAVAAAAPDGSAILLLHSGHVTLQALTRRLDLLAELSPVTTFATAPLVLVVPAASPHESLAGLLAAIAKAPGALNFGSAGAASPSHLAFERLAQQWPGGLKVTHVPFKSPTEPPAAVAARQLDFCFAIPPTVWPLVQAGRLRTLAITSAQRAPQFPDIPTFAEAGVPGFVDEPWFALALPAKAPPELVDRLARATRTAAAAPAFESLLVRSGGAVELSASPQQFAARLRAELQADTALLARLGIKPD